jgi:poly-gamma-glutamate synthesis protein (capsule biosynthesis protein)
MKVVVTGDFSPINRIAPLIKEKNFAGIYNDILPILNDADLAITNLEAPLTSSVSRIDKTGPALKADKDSVEAIKFGGFSLVTLANNHCLDYGEEGLKDTMQILKENGIAFVGAGRNNTEARKASVFKKAGKTLSVLAFAENEWSTTSDDHYGANPLNIIDNFYDIAEARKTSDYVLIVVHCGLEHYQLPLPGIKKLMHFFIDIGADAVVCHHTHCFSGCEIYKGKPIVYSLGNFIFDSPGKKGNWNKGVIAILDFESSGTNLSLVPYIQNDDKIGARLLDKKQNEEFLIEMKNLSSIILDDKQLVWHYRKQLESVRRRYLWYLQPFSFRIFRALEKYKLLPEALLKKGQRQLLLNIIRCETHRDIILNLLRTY